MWLLHELDYRSLFLTSQHNSSNIQAPNSIIYEVIHIFYSTKLPFPRCSPFSPCASADRAARLCVRSTSQGGALQGPALHTWGKMPPPPAWTLLHRGEPREDRSCIPASTAAGKGSSAGAVPNRGDASLPGLGLMGGFNCRSTPQAWRSSGRALLAPGQRVP